MKTIIILLALTLTACAGTQARNAELWRQANIDRQLETDRQAKRIDSMRSSFLAQAQSCTDDTCRVAIAGFSALSTQNNQDQVLTATPPPYERDGAAKFRDVLTGLVPILSTLSGAAVNYKQAEHNRDIQLGQYNFLSSTIGYTTTAAQNIANAGPRIDVGGDYVSGTQHVGDDVSVGRDQISGTQTMTTTETTTRDSNNNNRNNSNDDSNNGGSCASGNGGNVGGTAAQPGTAGTSVGCTAGSGGGP